MVKFCLDCHDVICAQKQPCAMAPRFGEGLAMFSANSKSSVFCKFLENSAKRRKNNDARLFWKNDKRASNNSKQIKL
jgi:hypothetical protein